VKGLAEKRGYKVIERHIMPEELGDFEQAFLTGTAAEVTPIQCIEGAHGNFKYSVGEITKQLMADYSELVNA
jgi:branched-chain amino acid aminotransferase